ncbi:hypothetical protein AVEN_9652-1 [Araneus ventricosus]|uniref:Uncharacterized protein n=1 Tax=Araneus ventricosus TaxID=182803 RepID=A0A4Y2EZ41_ARAVE|nr:hypothetical protein AVEN_9652-1 [Araneus ventricosus]
MLHPLISHALPILATAAKIHIKELEVLQNKPARQISNMPWFVRNKDKDLQLTSVKDSHKQLSRKFFEKLDSNDNAALQEIAEYDPHDPKNIRKPRRQISS